MRNVKIETKGRRLVITVDLDAEMVTSSTGKTLSLASSLGNQRREDEKGDIFVGLNIYRYPPR